MRAYILSNRGSGTIPHALLPDGGKSVLNYVVDEVLLQKQITDIIIVVSEQTEKLVRKHMTHAYPGYEFSFSNAIGNDPTEYIELNGSVHTSLRLQDLIRYYQQYKTITFSAHDKADPKPIPFTVYPSLERRDAKNTHTYNCGSGYLVCH